MSGASEQIAADLRLLGVQTGDVVLAKADVRFMRLKREKDVRLDYADELRDGLLKAVGASGTVVALTFTQTSVLGPFMRRPTFTASIPANTGGLANSMIKHERALRSTHPTNSFTAIGPMAYELTRFHTPFAHSHRPIEDLVAVGGKMIIVGCVDINPGFSTVHLAQHHLGFGERNAIAGHVTAKYVDRAGRERTFVKREIPGCSLGFGKMYPVYREAGVLIEGEVARAPSYLIGAASAYGLDVRMIASNPLFVLCEDPYCVDCRVFKTYAPTGRGRALVRIARRMAVPYARSAYARLKPGSANGRS